jgi:HEAT repeat protein
LFRRFVSTAFFSVFLILSAVTAFGQAGDGETEDWRGRSDILLRKLEHGNSEEKRDALFAIRNLRSEKASRLAISALKDPEEIVRATAAASVVFLPDSEALAALTPLLSDRADFVRREGAYALGEVGSPAAIGPLVKLLRNDKVLEVRAAAAVSLGKLGDVSAIPDLIAVLKAGPKEDTEFLRRSAARSVGQIAQIINTGKRRVLTPQNFLPEKYKDTPSQRPDELSTEYPQFEAAIPVLIGVLRNARESGDVRREAAFALGAIGDASSIAVLRTEITSSDPYLAEIAKEALLKIEGPGSPH